MSTIKSSAENLTLNADGANNDVIIQSNGSTKVTVDGQNSRVGIGTTSPDYPLHIKTNSVSDVLRVEDTSANSNPNISIKNDARTYQLQTVGARSDSFEIWDGTAAATRLAIDTTGVVSIPQGIELGSGIDATAANTLDDYEEGTWTPVVTGSGGAPSSSTFHTNPSGTYTKVGRLVTVAFYLHINSLTGGSGDFQLTGVPFTAMSVSGGFKGAISMYYANSSSHSDPILQINGSAILYIQAANGANGYFSNVSWVNAPLSAFASATAMSGTVTFMST